MDELLFIPQYKLTPIHSKKSRRNQIVTFVWKLYKAVKLKSSETNSNTSSFSTAVMDVQPRIPELNETLIDLKNKIPDKLNSNSAFDFKYVNAQGDCIWIQGEHPDNFLSFIFLDNLWQEADYYLPISYLYDYVEIEKGEIRIKV